MAIFQYTVVILSVFFSLGLAEFDFNIKPSDIHNSINLFSQKSVKIDANIDYLIDNNIDGIRSTIARHDPGPLKEVELRVILLLFMDLKNGWVQNLSQLNRSGNCKLEYKDKSLTFDMNFGWKDISFDYEYKLKLWPIPRFGDLHGQLFDLNANIVIEFDFKTFEVTLRRLEFNEARKINISLEGHVLDKFYNLVLKTVTNFAKSKVLKNIQEVAIQIVKLEIEDLNEQLGKKNGRQFTFVNRVSE